MDPIHSFRFAVEIEGVPVGWFTECSALTLEREVLPRAEGGVNDFVHQLPGRVKPSRITLKRGLADNKLWDWFQQGVLDGNVDPQEISIVLYDSEKAVVTRWDMSAAYPARWTGPDFDSSSSQIAVETLEIVSGGSNEGSAIQRAGPTDETLPVPETPVQSTTEIDLPVLAEKVYALFRQELRLERERLGRRWL